MWKRKKYPHVKPWILPSLQRKIKYFGVLFHIVAIETKYNLNCLMGFPGASDGKESACSVEDPCSNPGLERFSGKGNGHPIQYSCLENSMD